MEARSATTWISENVGRSRGYKPPKGTNLRKYLKSERKALEAAIQQPGPTSETECKRSPPPTLSPLRPLRGCVGMACRRKHIRAPPAKTLFEREEAPPVVLISLREAKLSQMVSLAALGGGGGPSRGRRRERGALAGCAFPL